MTWLKSSLIELTFNLIPSYPVVATATVTFDTVFKWPPQSSKGEWD